MAEADFGGREGELTLRELQSLGYGPDQARWILSLLADRDRMEVYLSRGKALQCELLTRQDSAYPPLVRKRLGGESPCCLFCKGDRSLLEKPCISLVGSRDLRPFNREFAREAGIQAARHGLCLVSGNARGADRTAQQSCLEAGGSVISIVADALCEKPAHPRILYVSLDDYDADFSAQRALSRNRVIHTLGYLTLVSQCSLETGGTWSGTTQNLKYGWSLVVCCRDGSPASLELQNRGAYLLGKEDLENLTDLRDPQMTLF